MASERNDTRRGRQVPFWKLSRGELVIFLLYVAMLCFEVVFYRQSEDEGRAWILARSYGVFRLVFHILRFEGHPALYYLILWGPAHFGVPFVWMNRLSIAIACTATLLLIRLAPFPLFLRAILPFGFALGYQYAVNFRGYAVIPLLAFLAAHEYRQEQTRPITMGVILALLANLSIHGTMIAAGFAAAYTAKLIGRARIRGLSPQQTSRAVVGMTLFAGSVVMVAVCVWPAKYLRLPLGEMLPKLVHRLEGPRAYRTPVPDRPLEAYRPQAIWHPASLAVTSSTRRAALATLPAPQDAVPVDHAAEVRRLAFVYPVARWAPLALGFEVLVVVYLVKRGEHWLLLPVALIAYFFVFVYVQLWHTGLIWVTLVAVLWAAWDTSAPFRLRGAQGAVASLFFLVGLLQLPWTLGALRYIKSNATHPASATAAYLKSLAASSRIDGNEIAFTVMPYFSHFIFVDRGGARFAGTHASPVPLAAGDFIAERADIILLRETDVRPEEAIRLTAAGYETSRRYCGAPYFPDVPVVTVCILVFRKSHPEYAGLSRLPGENLPTLRQAGPAIGYPSHHRAGYYP